MALRADESMIKPYELLLHLERVAKEAGESSSLTHHNNERSRRETTMGILVGEVEDVQGSPMDVQDAFQDDEEQEAMMLERMRLGRCDRDLLELIKKIHTQRSMNSDSSPSSSPASSSPSSPSSSSSSFLSNYRQQQQKESHSNRSSPRNKRSTIAARMSAMQTESRSMEGGNRESRRKKITKYVGQRVQVFERNAESYSSGTVSSYNPIKPRPFKVTFDDGEEEWVASEDIVFVNHVSVSPSSDASMMDEGEDSDDFGGGHNKKKRKKRTSTKLSGEDDAVIKEREERKKKYIEVLQEKGENIVSIRNLPCFVKECDHMYLRSDCGGIIERTDRNLRLPQKFDNYMIRTCQKHLKKRVKAEQENPMNDSACEICIGINHDTKIGYYPNTDGLQFRLCNFCANRQFYILGLHEQPANLYESPNNLPSL